MGTLMSSKPSPSIIIGKEDDTDITAEKESISTEALECSKRYRDSRNTCKKDILTNSLSTVRAEDSRPVVIGEKSGITNQKPKNKPFVYLLENMKKTSNSDKSKRLNRPGGSKMLTSLPHPPPHTRSKTTSSKKRKLSPTPSMTPSLSPSPFQVQKKRMNVKSSEDGSCKKPLRSSSISSSCSSVTSIASTVLIDKTPTTSDFNQTPLFDIAKEKNVYPFKPVYKTPRAHGKYSTISLVTRLYNSLDSLRAEMPVKTHLGTPCTPLLETVTINRNGDKIKSWETISVPKYFSRVEINADIDKNCVKNVVGNNDQNDLKSGVTSLEMLIFKRATFCNGIYDNIQTVINCFRDLRAVSNVAVTKNAHDLAFQNNNNNNYWPLGVCKKRGYRSMCDPVPLRIAAAVPFLSKFENGRNVYTQKIFFKYFSTFSSTTLNCFNGEADVSAKAQKRIRGIQDLMEVFSLSQEASTRVLSKKTSLLYEVATMCNRWVLERAKLKVPSNVPREHARYTMMIGSEELYYQVKLGVYFVPKTGTVFKFLKDGNDLVDFVTETAFGLEINKIKGSIGVISVCPEAFCIESEFAGVPLNEVVNADHNGPQNRPQFTVSSLNNVHNNSNNEYPDRELIQHHIIPIRKLELLYAVRMLQATKTLPAGNGYSSRSPILDSYTATFIVSMIRNKMLNNLPFVLAEIINIVTRLDQQGLVNPDIKDDNIVIDGLTGQPKMIDFGLILPMGEKDVGNRNTTKNKSSNGSFESITNFPQIAPEYFKRGVCTEATMTFSLAYMIRDTLQTLCIRTGDPGAVNLYTSSNLTHILTKCYLPEPKDRPKAHKIAQCIGYLFPFPRMISELFSNPKHVLYSQSTICKYCRHFQ